MCALKGKLCCTDCTRIMHGFGYNQKFHGKRGFCNLANSRTSQFMFSKYLIEYQNVKIVKSKFKSEKSNQKQTKATVLKENEKKKTIKKKFCLLGDL